MRVKRPATQASAAKVPQIYKTGHRASKCPHIALVTERNFSVALISYLLMAQTHLKTAEKTEVDPHRHLLKTQAAISEIFGHFPPLIHKKSIAIPMQIPPLPVEMERQGTLTVTACSEAK